MNCLLVINTMSGSASKVKENELIQKYAPEDNVKIKYLVSKKDEYDVNGIDKLIICGGDGTLSRAINLCKDREITIYYLPCGTFNETAKNAKNNGDMLKIASIGEQSFTYVAATGSFTGLGQASNSNLKQKFKILAYVTKILSYYKVHRINARICADKVDMQGEYTLLMISNARRCFGFNFNRLHDNNGENVEVIAIKAPKSDKIIGKIKMFFPFFRVFFLGFKREHFSNNISFFTTKNLTVSLRDKCDFCIDGECVSLSGELPICKNNSKAKVVFIS